MKPLALLLLAAFASVFETEATNAAPVATETVSAEPAPTGAAESEEATADSAEDCAESAALVVDGDVRTTSPWPRATDVPPPEV